jgi:ATP-dependent Clp protease ATP-binding subunit ClpA
VTSFSDIDRWLDSSGLKLIEAAREKTQGFGQRYFRGPQILLAALETGMLDNALLRQGCEPDDAIEWLAPLAEKATTRYSGTSDAIVEAATANNVIAKGRELERPLNEFDLVEMILSAHLGFVSSELKGCPFSFDEAYLEISNLNEAAAESAAVDAGGPGKPAVTKQASAKFGEILARYATNLSDGAKDRDKGLYEHRIDDVRKIGGILGRLMRPNPLIVGDPGVGKTALVEGLAGWLQTDEAPEWLRDCKIFMVSCNSLIAGAGYQPVSQQGHLSVDGRVDHQRIRGAHPDQRCVRATFRGGQARAAQQGIDHRDAQNAPPQLREALRVRRGRRRPLRGGEQLREVHAVAALSRQGDQRAGQRVPDGPGKRGKGR